MKKWDFGLEEEEEEEEEEEDEEEEEEEEGGGGGGNEVHAKILPSNGLENNIVQPKSVKCLIIDLHLIFHRFSPFNCCLKVVL